MQQVTWNQQKIAPSKIICVGRNYADHIKELNNAMPGELVLFLKPNSSLSDTLRCPLQRCRYETEIVLLLNQGKAVAVGLGLDLTLVEVQERLKAKSLPWEKAKAFDGAAVCSPFVDAPASLDALWLRLTIGGEVRQEGGVSLMLTPPAKILEEAQQHFTLCDGDLVMTGTPKGVGDLHQGETLVAQLFHDQTLLLEHSWLAH